MAAIPYPDPDQLPGLAGLYGDIAGLGRGVLNLYRVMGHSPRGLRAYMGLSHFVRDQTALPAKTRELAVLQTGLSTGCDYITHQHVRAAAAAGVPRATIEAVLAGRLEALDERERTAVEYARHVGESRRAEAGTLAALRRLFSLEEISELALSIGMYHLCAAVLMGLRVEDDA